MSTTDRIGNMASKLAARHPVHPIVLSGDVIVEGLTRRELFAAIALHGLIASNLPNPHKLSPEDSLKAISLSAIIFADSLCTELDKPQVPPTPPASFL